MMDRLLKIKLKKETVMFILFCVGAVLIFAFIVKITDYFVSSAKAEERVKKAFEQNQESSKAENMAQFMAGTKTVADNLKRRNPFALGMNDAQAEFPVRTVDGIFGDEVLINNNWYKQGASVGDAQIVAIEPTSVRIKWQDMEREFVPIDNPIPQQGNQGRNGGRGRGPMNNMDMGQAIATFVQNQFGQINPADIQQMQNQFQNMMGNQFGGGGRNRGMGGMGGGRGGMMGGGMGGMGGGMGGGGRGGRGGGGGMGGGGGGGGRGGGGGGGGGGGRGG